MADKGEAVSIILNIRTREGVDIEEMDVEKDVVEITWSDGWHDVYYSKEYATKQMRKKYRMVKRY